MDEWWHVIEFSNGETSPGQWDLRPLAEKIPWPDLAGKRCLDIGTASGFWAFELERRGAAEVLATDADTPFAQRSRRHFEEARERRGSGVRYETRDVFDLEGTYDVAFMGGVRARTERLDARRDGREWFVFNPRGMRKVVELAGWTVEAQTGVLAEHLPQAARHWKWRTGVRGRSCALRARRSE